MKKHHKLIVVLTTIAVIFTSFAGIISFADDGVKAPSNPEILYTDYGLSSIELCSVLSGESNPYAFSVLELGAVYNRTHTNTQVFPMIYSGGTHLDLGNYVVRYNTAGIGRFDFTFKNVYQLKITCEGFTHIKGQNHEANLNFKTDVPDGSLVYYEITYYKYQESGVDYKPYQAFYSTTSTQFVSSVDLVGTDFLDYLTGDDPIFVASAVCYITLHDSDVPPSNISIDAELPISADHLRSLEQKDADFSWFEDYLRAYSNDGIKGILRTVLDSVSSVLSVELFDGFSIGAMLSIFVGLFGVIAFLKLFAGG